jgi:hypothetical protein
MSDNDLLDRFDAVLPRFKLYQASRVPAAGSKELVRYQDNRFNLRMDIFVSGIVAVVFGLMAIVGYPAFAFWVNFICVVVAASMGISSADHYLQLAFGQRLEQALPAGTDARTAQLEDGTLGLIRKWNADAFDWNRRVDELRLEFTGWQLLAEIPETRGLEWTEVGSKIKANALVAAVQGLSADRSVLVARQDVIDRRLKELDSRLLRLKAAEDVTTLALPPPKNYGDTDSDD